MWFSWAKRKNDRAQFCWLPSHRSPSQMRGAHRALKIWGLLKTQVDENSAKYRLLKRWIYWGERTENTGPQGRGRQNLRGEMTGSSTPEFLVEGGEKDIWPKSHIQAFCCSPSAVWARSWRKKWKVKKCWFCFRGWAAWSVPPGPLPAVQLPHSCWSVRIPSVRVCEISYVGFKLYWALTWKSAVGEMVKTPFSFYVMVFLTLEFILRLQV